MKDVGIGIIGFGRQGFRLAEHIRNDIQHGKLAAVCRRSEAGKDYSKKHGIKLYFDYHDLLKDKDIDAAIITTPSSLHGIQALDALKSSKHLLIDKPIASTIKEGEKILSLAKKKNLIVGINFPLRVNPVTNVLKNHLKDIGKLKKIHLFISHGPPRCEWQSDITLSMGGVILDLGSHYFDLISFLTGCLPKIISNAYSEKIENENSGFVDLIYQDFSVSMILLRNQKMKKNIITCAGDKGSLSADYVRRKVILSTDLEFNEIECPVCYDFEIVLKNLVGAINKKEEIFADAKAGLDSLKTALSIYNAVKTKRSTMINYRNLQ